jgi:hypothetical protein
MGVSGYYPVIIWSSFSPDRYPVDYYPVLSGKTVSGTSLQHSSFYQLHAFLTSLNFKQLNINEKSWCPRSADAYWRHKLTSLGAQQHYLRLSSV